MCVPQLLPVLCQRIWRLKPRAALPAKELRLLVMLTLGRCAGAAMGAAWRAAGDVAPVVGEHHFG